MPDTPDFTAIAEKLAPGPPYVSLIIEALRLVWNARGAADIAKLEFAFDPEVSNGQPSMKTIDQVLRSLDR